MTASAQLKKEREKLGKLTDAVVPSQPQLKVPPQPPLLALPPLHSPRRCAQANLRYALKPEVGAHPALAGAAVRSRSCTAHCPHLSTQEAAYHVSVEIPATIDFVIVQSAIPAVLLGAHMRARLHLRAPRVLTTCSRRRREHGCCALPLAAQP